MITNKPTRTRIIKNQDKEKKFHKLERKAYSRGEDGNAVSFRGLNLKDARWIAKYLSKNHNLHTVVIYTADNLNYGRYGFCYSEQFWGDFTRNKKIFQIVGMTRKKAKRLGEFFRLSGGPRTITLDPFMDPWYSSLQIYDNTNYSKEWYAGFDSAIIESQNHKMKTINENN